MNTEECCRNCKHWESIDTIRFMGKCYKHMEYSDAYFYCVEFEPVDNLVQESINDEQ